MKPMDEQALQGLLAALWALARLVGAAGMVIAGLVFLFRALFPTRNRAAPALDPHSGVTGVTGAGMAGSGGERGSAKPSAARGPAPPRRPGLAELAELCRGAGTRGYYRSLLAERLRALGRDALALREDLSDEEAYGRLRQGGGFLDSDSENLLFSDHFAAPRARGADTMRPWRWFRNKGKERGPDAATSFVTPFLDRVDGYLRGLSDYMQGPGGNDGQHKH
jgi:hypothetical protein